MLEMPLEPPPEQLLGELTAAGAQLVSLNPIRQTLEDFFVEQVTMPEVVAADRGLDDEKARSASMKATAAIAVNVFRESVRDKVLYNLVLFAVLLIGGSYLLGQLTAGQDIKIIKDLGLAATSLFGLFIAVFIGIGLVSKEVERRSIYSLLAKPIHRSQLVARQVRRVDADAGRQRRASWRPRCTPCSPTWRGACRPTCSARGTRRRSIRRCSRPWA